MIMHAADLIVFFAYLIGITLFGASFFRKNKSAADFTLGNQNIPGAVLTLSIFATFVSSISFLALPGSAYQANWNAFVFSLSIPIAALVGVRVFVPLYRQVNSPSAYTYLEQRFGPWARSGPRGKAMRARRPRSTVERVRRPGLIGILPPPVAQRSLAPAPSGGGRPYGPPPGLRYHPHQCSSCPP